MLEITRLREITSNDFKNTIDNAISNKYFIRNGIQNNTNNITNNITIYEQLAAINNLLFNQNNSHILIKTIGNVEWTPIKLYDTAYYMVNIYNKFWLITHNSYDKFVIKYSVIIKDYICFLFNFIKNITVESIPLNLYLTSHELYYSYYHLHSNKLQYILIKQMSFIDSIHKINHYLINIDNKIYYFPISNINVYKPILYSII
jgi:hypothetical protein